MENMTDETFDEEKCKQYGISIAQEENETWTVEFGTAGLAAWMEIGRRPRQGLDKDNAISLAVDLFNVINHWELEEGR